MSPWLSIADAARSLGKSERTIRRYVAGQKLPFRDTPAGVQVEITDSIGASVQNGPDSCRTETGTPDSDRLLAEVDKLAALNRHLTEEVHYLRTALAAALQRPVQLLPEPTRKNPWWRFWG